MRLGPKALKLFSPAAQRFLARLERPAPPTRKAVAEMLRAVGRPVFDAAIEFEIHFGGLVFGPPRKRKDVHLGIDYRPPRRLSAAEDDPELTLVPIGVAHDGCDLLYMNELGEVVVYVDSVVMKNSSITSYIEQELIWYTRAWRRPRFYADLMPAMGEPLASALGLQRIPLVSDAFEVWWETERVRVRQVFFAGTWQFEGINVSARSLEELMKVLSAARTIDPLVRVSVGAEPLEEVRPTRRQRKSAPTMESWASFPGAERYPFASSDRNVTGAVWYVRERGAARIEQYRAWVPSQGPSELLSWDTFTAMGGTSRNMEDE